jgi:hypothetical protein
MTKISALFFFLQIIKTLDPDWIRIRIHLKCWIRIHSSDANGSVLQILDLFIVYLYVCSDWRRSTLTGPWTWTWP